eukprot:12060179-Karenia_brevis.AAC.1
MHHDSHEHSLKAMVSSYLRALQGWVAIKTDTTSFCNAVDVLISKGMALPLGLLAHQYKLWAMDKLRYRQWDEFCTYSSTDDDNGSEFWKKSTQEQQQAMVRHMVQRHFGKLTPGSGRNSLPLDKRQQMLCEALASHVQ